MKTNAQIKFSIDIQLSRAIDAKTQAQNNLISFMSGQAMESYAKAVILEQYLNRLSKAMENHDARLVCDNMIDELTSHLLSHCHNGRWTCPFSNAIDNVKNDVMSRLLSNLKQELE
ncbi:MAG: hypothetical protein E6Q97_07635 [Desulfurellales bacterium]|nr:MAG: hypothetical protein E6Q97_07635 [Desulfurellales bacterium]